MLRQTGHLGHFISKQTQVTGGRVMPSCIVGSPLDIPWARTIKITSTLHKDVENMVLEKAVCYFVIIFIQAVPTLTVFFPIQIIHVLNTRHLYISLTGCWKRLLEVDVMHKHQQEEGIRFLIYMHSSCCTSFRPLRRNTLFPVTQNLPVRECVILIPWDKRSRGGILSCPPHPY